MIKRRTWQISEAEVTPESIYRQRRRFIKSGLQLGAGSIALGAMPAGAVNLAASDSLSSYRELPHRKASSDTPGFDAADEPAPFDSIISYNNFYEFGMNKTDPAKFAHEMKTDPWRVKITGHVESPGNYHLDDLMQWGDFEERIYRLRCVEAWSMVVPWVGYELARLIDRVKPTSKAKYVVFETKAEPAQMRGVRSRFALVDWPYVEALTIEEATNPLTLLTFGLYGRVLPNQNGAPIRLVVPWKYGFKSIKSIVSIRFTDKPPQTTWQSLQPKEYGFYANVNPNVSHPRWSQARERRLPGGIFGAEVIDTQLFNGYVDAVGHLYKGLDLAKHY